MVIRNYHRNTGVMTKVTKKHTHVVLMDSGGICVTKLSHEVFKNDWEEFVGYDTKDIAQRLLNVGSNYFGITQEAEHELKQLIAEN